MLSLLLETLFPWLLSLVYVLLLSYSLSMPGESLQLPLLQDLSTKAVAQSPDLGSALRAWLQWHHGTNGWYDVERGIVIQGLKRDRLLSPPVLCLCF